MKNNTKFITGLKALGAIMIVISHLKMQFSGYTDWTWKLITFPAYFIVLFICISAFTISLSIDKRENFNLIQYMKRRWIRLAPSYYLILLVGLALKTLVVGWGYFTATVGNLPYLFLFLNLDPIHTPSQSSILGVEWMLPIMFWLYLLIPLLLVATRKMFPIFLVMFAISIFLHFTPQAITTYTGFGGFGWSMQFYLVMYTLTIFIYYLHSKSSLSLHSYKSLFLQIINGLGVFLCFFLLLYYLHNRSEQFYSVCLLVITGYGLWFKKPFLRFLREKEKIFVAVVENADFVILGVILVKYMINLYFIKNPHIILTLWFIALLIIGMHRSFLIRVLFENKWMQWLGTISFGIYLIHPMAITVAERTIPMQFPFVRVLLIFPLTIVAATIVYRYIEVPIAKRFR